MHPSFDVGDLRNIFLVFYAIFWGGIFGVLPRWRAFDWPLAFKWRTYRKALNRALLAFLLFNILPIAFFGYVMCQLSAAPPSSYSVGRAIVDLSLRAVVPAFAILGIYRLWLAVVELRPDWFYVDRSRIYRIPAEYRHVEPIYRWHCLADSFDAGRHAAIDVHGDLVVEPADEEAAGPARQVTPGGSKLEKFEREHGGASDGQRSAEGAGNGRGGGNGQDTPTAADEEPPEPPSPLKLKGKARGGVAGLGDVGAGADRPASARRDRQILGRAPHRARLHLREPHRELAEIRGGHRQPAHGRGRGGEVSGSDAAEGAGESGAVGLTRIQRDTMRIIRELSGKDCIAPSYDEIARELCLYGKGGVARVVDALVQRGYLARRPHQAPSLTILRRVPMAEDVEFVGTFEDPALAAAFGGAGG